MLRAIAKGIIVSAVNAIIPVDLQKKCDTYQGHIANNPEYQRLREEELYLRAMRKKEVRPRSYKKYDHWYLAMDEKSFFLQLCKDYEHAGFPDRSRLEEVYFGKKKPVQQDQPPKWPDGKDSGKKTITSGKRTLVSVTPETETAVIEYMDMDMEINHVKLTPAEKKQLRGRGINPESSDNDRKARHVKLEMHRNPRITIEELSSLLSGKGIEGVGINTIKKFKAAISQAQKAPSPARA